MNKHTSAVESASNTIFKAIASTPVEDAGSQSAFIEPMMASFASNWKDDDIVKAAYEAHNAEVRATVPPDRLFEYQPDNGWDPLCEALNLPVPDIAFPHTNTTAEFQEHMRKDR